MIQIRNFTKRKVNQVFLKKIIATVLQKEKKSKSEISIVFMGKKRIKGLNKKYRGKDYVADVLSFTQDQAFGLPLLGDVIVCLDKIESNAKKNKKTFREELSLILIHGTLHLLGYDHEKSIKDARIMEEKQNYYLSLVL